MTLYGFSGAQHYGGRIIFQRRRAYHFRRGRPYHFGQIGFWRPRNFWAQTAVSFRPKTAATSPQKIGRRKECGLEANRKEVFCSPNQGKTKKRGVASTIFSVFQVLFPLVEGGRTAPGQIIHLSMNQAWRRTFSLTIWQRHISKKKTHMLPFFFVFTSCLSPDPIRASKPPLSIRKRVAP